MGCGISTRRRVACGLLACLTASGCARWRAITEKGTPNEVIQREAARDQVDLINDLQQAISGLRAGRIEQ